MKMKQKCIIKDCKSKAEGLIEQRPFCTRHYKMFIVLRKSKNIKVKRFNIIIKEITKMDKGMYYFIGNKW